LNKKLPLNSNQQTKLDNIKQFFREKTVVVAFSGGVDSTLVMELAHQYAKRAVAVTADSITILPGEVDKAKELAKVKGYEHQVYEINELEDENFAKNPFNRCYYCKSGLAEILTKVANDINADLIVEGTNITEVTGHRPGLQAIKENKIDSPLLNFGFDKQDIRILANFFDLPNSEKPSLACLSSRFPTGVRITPEKLRRVGLAERYIIDTYNIKILRVRDHEGLARIEVAPEERKILLKEAVFDDLQKKLKEYGFDFVAIDCQGYKTGSLSDIAMKQSEKTQLLTEIEINL
jgi:uncharacterized protein